MVAKKKNEQKVHLRPETVESIFAVAAVLLGLIFILARFELAGLMGRWVFTSFSFLLGKAYFLMPLTLFLVALTLILSLKEKILGSSLLGGALLLLSSLGLANIIFGGSAAGFLGYWITRPFLYFFDSLASGIIYFGLLAVSLLITFNASIRRSMIKKNEPVPPARVPMVLAPSAETASSAPPVKKDVKADMILQKLKKDAKDYFLPPLSLLETDKGKPSAGDIKANANIIQRTLQDFGIPVEMAEVSIGPSVTQYTLKPAQGVRLSRIVALQNDLALALAAHPLRIEAPIPGKSFVGIEVPNKSIALVGLRNLLEDETYQKGGPLVFALGKDVSGQSLFADLARMPHLLIAGSTGSGKSVAIHSLMMALLYKNTPLSLRLLLIDPKRVELTHYHDIPHLLTSVITSNKEAISALRWAVKEMEERYKILESSKCRDVASYNARGDDFVPYIVIIIDELADLMTSFGRDAETSIVRIAQMARAVGIHLVLSTQRPSVEVITGLIKANITSRVAFQVASQIDSRTILDMAGAEKLLGSGDMLYLAGDVSKPKRIQGGFVSENEVKKVSEFVRSQEAELEYNADIVQTRGNDLVQSRFGGDDERDELYEDAYRVVQEAGKASASFLQRRLKVGYARAARLLDILEERGVIGPGEGAKPREVFGKKSEIENGGIF